MKHANKRLLFTIDTDTEPREAEKAHIQQRKHGRPVLQISKQLTSEQIINIVEKHRGYKHWIDLLHLIAVQESARGAVHDHIIHSTDDASVLDTIATSGIATPETLITLQKSNSESARKHAYFALLRLSLDQADTAEFQRVIAAHSGPSLDDASVRAFVAAHRRVPASILKKLTLDSVNFVQQTALTRLEKKNPQ